MYDGWPGGRRFVPIGRDIGLATTHRSWVGLRLDSLQLNSSTIIGCKHSSTGVVRRAVSDQDLVDVDRGRAQAVLVSAS